MAAIHREYSDFRNSEDGEGTLISRQGIQAAIAKAVELRALHAALMQGNSPATLRLPSASPVSRQVPHFSSQDYPIFTPSYEDEPLPGSQQILLENRRYTDSWGDYTFDVENIDETILSHFRAADAASTKELPSELMSLERHVCPADDQNSLAGSCANNMFVVRASPRPESCKSRRNSLGDFKSVSSYNKCKSAIIISDSDGLTKNSKKPNIIMPLTVSHNSPHSQPRNKGLGFSRLFPKLRKKNKNGNSPVRPEPEEVSQMLKDLGMLSIETLQKEVMEAHGTRDAALTEVAEMKSSIGELSQKLEYLEAYCEELKKALRQAVQIKNSQPAEKPINFPRRTASVNGNAENSLPVSDEVMVEGFLQIVSEARLSVKQFCKTLLGQIKETDHTILENLNALLQPHKVSLNSKHSKSVLYHLEAIINQSLYQDFENCVFQKNGTPKLLDPQQERQARFQLFATLRNLSWNEVLRKGTKYYSDEFSKFCDQKMNGIISTTGWSGPWPEQLLQAFFVAAKCIWLLHLLAFSFNPPLSILRVDENRPFEPHYMDDVFRNKQRPQTPSRVKIMVMPGFYVHDKVVKCKVLCIYKSVV